MKPRLIIDSDTTTRQPTVLTDSPIINSPYEEPRWYWHIQEGQPPQKRQGRRMASYFFRVPERAARGKKTSAKNQTELFEGDERGQEYLLEPAETLRDRLRQWRQRDYENATSVTKELIRHWHETDRRHRLFFAQLEAAETVIFLTEGSTDLKQGINIPRDRPSTQAQIEGYKGFLRYALKMATGSGKTTVMGMLAAWTLLNRVNYRQDTRFADTVLIICPNVTIRDRLQELDPQRGDLSLYRTRDLVPPHRMRELAQGDVFISNWHRLERQEVNHANGQSARVVQRGERVTTVKAKTIKGEKIEVAETRYLESDRAFVTRILKNRKGRSPSIFVFNDEAHHAYRRGEHDNNDTEVVLDKELAQRNEREATVWIDGLDRLHKTLHRGHGIRLCVDLSATPFYIQGSGNEVGKPFPWVVSDFSLLDAIEAGLVKIPQLPTHDISGSKIPPYFNIWRWVEEQAQKDGISGAIKPDTVLRYAATPIIVLAAEWEKTFEIWQTHYAQGLRQYPTPPVFIIVCRDTALAKEIYDWLAEGQEEYGPPPPCFRNQRGQQVTVRIDSKIAEDIEAGSGKDEERRLRFILDTVGKMQWPGGKVPADYAELVRKNNEKALEDETLDLLDETIPPGRDIRCIISVSMLAEGWDASTVTHIIGLRPFGSQLLCEQVVGRALRRTSYATDPSTGLFREETAKVFGVPFELIPFKVTGQNSPPPTPPSNHIYADPSKLNYTIEFPIVEGYHDPGLVDLQLDWERVSTLTLDPLKIPDAILVRGLSTADGRLAAYGPGCSELVDLDQWRRETRIQQTAFRLTEALLRRCRQDKGEAIPPHRLFPRILTFVKRFLTEKIICIGNRRPQDVTINPYFQQAVDMLFDALSPVDDNKAELPIIQDGPAGRGSTRNVDFWTGRDLWPVQHCHLNAMVADTDRWEQSAAFCLDTHPGVTNWVKNDHLGFAIPYRKNGAKHRYFPDFIAYLDLGINIIVEIKGMLSDDADLKQKAAQRWVDAVNRDGRFGLWRYEMLLHPPALSALLDQLCNQQRERILELKQM